MYDVDDAIPWWTIDNPQARGAAEPIPIEPIERWVPTLIHGDMPAEDPQVEYPGQGAVALWNDVWHYGTSIVHFFGRHGAGDSYVLSSTLDEAIDSAVGASVKSLSGFINMAYATAVDAQQWASRQLDALDANIGAIYSYFDGRISALEGQSAAVAELAIPSLQAQISGLRDDLGDYFAYNSAADRAWATDNIYKPLHENIGEVAGQIPVWAEGAYERATGYADASVNALGVNVLTRLVPLTVAVRALQTESEECTQPMCDTLGPKTDLGKLLKGLKLAASAALLAQLLAMDEHELETLLQSLASRFASLVTDFERFFDSGDETIGELISNAIGSAL